MMNLSRRVVTATLTVLAALVAAVALILAPTALAQPAPPSVVQLCAATGVEQVDTLLDGVADTDLVGDLAPLLDITVPREDGLTLDVDLDRLRQDLGCDPTTTPAPTPTPEPTAPAEPTTPGGNPIFANCDEARAAGAAPVILGDPGFRPELDSDGDGIGCEDGEDIDVALPDGNDDDAAAPAPVIVRGGVPVTG